MTEHMDASDVAIFTGIIAVTILHMIAYAVVIGLPEGVLPLLSMIVVVLFYESPLADSYKSGVRRLFD